MIRKLIAVSLLVACSFGAWAQNCIPSGVTDQYTYFVAVDATDRVTFETGLSSFTVYRSRNGGAAAAFTTPTINETDSTNMPGTYELLLDEDMTIDSGDDVQHMALRITATGMAPVTKEICVARAKITAGNTLAVAADGDVSGNVDGQVGSVNGVVPLTAAQTESEANDALVVHRLDELLNADSDIDGAAPPTVGSVFFEALTKTAGSWTYDQTTDSPEAIRDRGDAAWITATGFSTLTQAQVNAEVDAALADINLDHLLGTASGIPAIVAGTYFDQMLDDGTATYDRTTDSMQAQRDRLDSQIAEVVSSIGRRTTITVTDQDTFTLAAGATFNDAYNGWGVKINDAGSQDEWLGKVEDYVGSTKTVELNRTSGFTIATGDTVTLLPAFLYDPTDNADLNCTVNTANFAGSTTTLACILTDTDGAAVTSATGKLTGSEIEILSGAQAREKRYVFSTTWDGTNGELQITLDRALPATLADAVTAIIR